MLRYMLSYAQFYTLFFYALNYWVSYILLVANSNYIIFQFFLTAQIGTSSFITSYADGPLQSEQFASQLVTTY